MQLGWGQRVRAELEAVLGGDHDLKDGDQVRLLGLQLEFGFKFETLVLICAGGWRAGSGLGGYAPLKGSCGR